MMIRYIYTFFVGLFVAIFVGMGIAVFYEAPVAPEPPYYEGISMSNNKEPSEAERVQEAAYVASSKVYDEQMSVYNRNVSIIVIICSVIILSIALLLSEKFGVIADGLLLGGIFSLLYGVGRGMATDNNKYRFLIAAVGLLTTLILGYIKFTKQRPPEDSEAEKVV